MVDALGNGLHLILTPGQWADCPQLPALLAALRQPPGAVVADKAYDTHAVLQAIGARNAEPVIPPKTSRNEFRPYDQNLYADRNKAERFFGRLKEARGFATRYEKTAVSFLATAHLLAALDWLRLLSTHSSWVGCFLLAASRGIFRRATNCWSSGWALSSKRVP